MSKSVTAFAPATVANVAVGFDILGFAIQGVGDRVRVQKSDRKSVDSGSPPIRILAIEGVETDFPREAERNTATVGLLKLWSDLRLDFSLEVMIEKGIPTQSGMGGSAASAVAGLVAANALLADLKIPEFPLSPIRLLDYALIGEKMVSGAAHLDNVAPCLLGGMTLIQSFQDTPSSHLFNLLGQGLQGQGLQKNRITSIPIPARIRCVLVHPHLLLSTQTSRAALASLISLDAHVQQSALLAGLIAGCFKNDLTLIRESLRDSLIEPQREKLIPGFRAVQEAALSEGALGCSISGSGPSVFAWTEERGAKSIGDAMVKAFSRQGIHSDLWISPVSPSGAHLV